MENNFDIIIYDFEGVCRTCLSQNDLKPLYEKCLPSTCLVDMLMSCTAVKFTQDDGLPVKICTNCINEIKQAFLFAKRCEATDTILWKSLKIKTELANKSSQAQNVEPMIKAEEEIEAEVNLPNIHQTVEAVLGDYEFVEVDAETKIKQEEFVEHQEKEVKLEYEEFVEEQEDVKIEFKDHETYYDPADVSYVEDGDEDLDETNFEISNHEEKSLTDQGDTPLTTHQRVPTENEKGIRDFQHSAIHGEKKFLCNVCGKGFVSKNLLNIHSQDHTSVLPNACNVCGNAFCQLGHKQRYTGEKSHVCSVCSKAFTHNHTLKTHMRIHIDEKTYNCEICSKTFTRDCHLIRHMRIHTGEKPFTCKLCRKTFNQDHNLIRHMKVHTGEKPYTCKICSKTFNQDFNLIRHMRTHTGEKPYSCKICSKPFSHTGDLTRHIRLHTGEKPYNCEVCSKAFSRPTQLKCHMRLHTGEKPHTCEFCGKSVSTNRYLIKHKLIHADEIQSSSSGTTLGK